MRLRKIGYFAPNLAVAIKYQKGQRWDESTSFQETQDTLELTHVLNQLWERRPKHDGPMLRVGVTLHGFAVNLQPDLAHFALINPCGIGALGVTSAAAQLGQPVDAQCFKTLIAETLELELVTSVSRAP